MLAFWFQWPDHGGYNFVSGPLADITLATSFVAALALFWRHHNCHVHGCWRLSWHPHPQHDHPVCRKHHPSGQGRADHLKPEHHTEAAHARCLTVTRAHTSNATAVGAYATVGVTSFGSAEHEVVVGAPQPEKPKRERHGMKLVADLVSAEQPDVTA